MEARRWQCMELEVMWRLKLGSMAEVGGRQFLLRERALGEAISWQSYGTCLCRSSRKESYEFANEAGDPAYIIMGFDKS